MLLITRSGLNADHSVGSYCWSLGRAVLLITRSGLAADHCLLVYGTDYLLSEARHAMEKPESYYYCRGLTLDQLSPPSLEEG